MKSGKPGADIWTRTIGRRQLLKTLGLAGSILALGGPHGLAEAMAPSPPAAAGDIPRRALGKTGVDVSILCFGGAHWGRMEDDAEAIRCCTKPSMQASPFSTTPGNTTADARKNSWAGLCRAGGTKSSS